MMNNGMYFEVPNDTNKVTVAVPFTLDNGKEYAWMFEVTFDSNIEQLITIVDYIIREDMKRIGAPLMKHSFIDDDGCAVGEYADYVSGLNVKLTVCRGKKRAMVIEW